MTRRLLIVEDDRVLRLGLADTFALEGFEVAAAADGEEALRLLRSRHFDVLILDLMLPRKAGLAVLREIRADGLDTPVLILTARGDEADKVLGLELGADDYVTKPFGVRELVARVRALVRRDRRAAARGRPGPARFQVGEAAVDLEAFSVQAGGRRHALSPKEAGMLALLFADAGRVVSRDRFLDELWAGAEEVGHRAVDTHVLNLRKKLEPDPARPRFLVTVHGVGYKLLLEPEP